MCVLAMASATVMEENGELCITVAAVAVTADVLTYKLAFRHRGHMLLA